MAVLAASPTLAGVSPILSPPQSHANVPATSTQGRPFQQNVDWRTWPEVKVVLLGLPSNATTAIIHRNMRNFGNVSRIAIFESTQGGQLSRVEVVFKPPPAKQFWNNSASYNFIGVDKKTYQVHFKLVFAHRKYFQVKSAVREVVFPEETLLHGTELAFGILGKNNKLVVKEKVTTRSEKVRNADDQAKIHLILNLRRREIWVHFPVLLRSSSESGPRTRNYRFPVSFDDDFRVWKVKKKDGKTHSYIIHVKNPPWYSRRLETALGSSHVEDAKQWSEDDLWTRQTDIVLHKDSFQTINQTPISLQKNLNRINVARWTTFVFDIDTSPNNAQRADTFDEALKDFNISVNTESTDFEIDYDHMKDLAAYWTDVEDGGDRSDPLDDGCTLPFELRYQLEVCISNGRFSEYDVNKNFLRELKSLSGSKAKQMLVHVDAVGEAIRDPMSMFSDIRFQKPVRTRQLPSNCIMIHHATITATGIKIHTPSVDVSNRVIRKHLQFADRFLRVAFEDDEFRGQTKIYAASNTKMTLIIDRVRRALTSGINIAGRHYEFLAYGNSQLRDHGAYFFASTKELTATTIRTEMGAFDNEKIVAKRAARMGQCFSTTHPIHYRLPAITKENLIPDIVVNGCTFSDGVGKISSLAATLVHGSLGLSGPVPSCFQFRLGGCKGVLAIDPSLKAIAVQIRPSQFKFESKSQELEIIRYSQFWQPFLNRQIIIVLSNLGVRDQVFLGMQQATIKALDKAMKDDDAAIQALRTNVDPNLMTLSMCDLVSNGFRRVKEPFVTSLLELWRAWSLLYLKEKAKIPIKDGAFVLGVVDETNMLRGHFDLKDDSATELRAEKEKHLPEIFLQVTDPLSGNKKVVEGICILARNPSLHPGDIRVVKAVDVTSLHHLCDVVVMPQNGDRDLPSMCSGGDLDGDDYMVIWDPALIPDIWNVEPHHYQPPEPKMAVGEITTKDIIDFYVDYMENDSLGRIAHAHLGNADYFENGINNDHCLQLVQLHSTSVDYPKTGVPAKLPRRLEPVQWPHFMEKKGRSYKSGRILGQLYDEVGRLVKRFDFRARTNLQFDARILGLDRPESDYFDKVRLVKHDYDISLQRVMAQHKIKTEFEVWSTFVMSHSKKSRDFKFHEEIGRISKALKDEYRSVLINLAGGSDFHQLMPYAVAAYQLTAEQITEAWEHGSNRDDTEIEEQDAEADNRDVKMPKTPFCSFPWLLSDVLGRIASTSNLGNETPPIVAHGKDHCMKSSTVLKSEGTVKKVASISGRDPKTYAHNASPEFKRASGRSSSSTSSPQLFMDLDPFKGKSEGSSIKSTSSTVLRKGSESSQEAGKSAQEPISTNAIHAYEVSQQSRPTTIVQAKDRTWAMPERPLPPKDATIDEPSSQASPTWNLDVFATPQNNNKSIPEVPVKDSKKVSATYSPADWNAWATGEDSRPSSKDSSDSKLRADAPDSSPRAPSVVYKTDSFNRQDSSAARSSSSDSDSFVRVSQEVSPIEAGSSGEPISEESRLPARKPGMNPDPFLMSEEEKKAYIALDEDL